MLFLLFQLGDDSYALAADQVVEVIPFVELKSLRKAPSGIAGSFDYRGRFVPVIDLSLLELGRPAPSLLSTRIIMTHFTDNHGSSRLVGLIAEQATETLRCDPADFAPFVPGPRGLVQRVELDALLTPAVREHLLCEMADGDDLR